MTLSPEADRRPSDRPNPFSPGQDGQVFHFVSEILAGQLSTIESMRDVAIEGSDIEGVHKIRVATRRMRTCLKLFHEYLEPELYEVSRTSIKKMGKLFGKVRDLDVFRSNLISLAGDSLDPPDLNPLWEAGIADRYTRVQSKMVSFLTGEGYAQATNSIISLRPVLRDTDNPGLSAEIPVKLEALLANALNDRTPVFSPADYQDYHALRLDLKEFRYALEFFQDQLVPGRIEQLLVSLTALQDLLGSLNDHIVGLKIIEKLNTSLGDPTHHAALSACWHALVDQKEQRLDEFPQLWSNFINSRPAAILSAALDR